MACNNKTWLVNNFMKNHSIRVSFSIRFRVRVSLRVSDSVSASVSFVMNIMFEIAGREVLLALCLHTP